MKIIQILFFLLLFLILASCTNGNKDSDSIAKVSNQVIEQAKKDILSTDKINMETKTIILNAKKWEYDKKRITVKKWEKLILKVNNTDTLHGIAIPDMQLVWDQQIEVDTSQAWEFEYRCSNYCGVGHQEMTGMLVIEE